MVTVFETIMLICFGISWPVSVYKDIKSKTAKGKSIVFIIAIIFGYICGIAGKLCGHYINGAPLNYVLGLYILNLVIVSVDLGITISNMRRDAAQDTPKAVAAASVVAEGEQAE